MHQNKTMQTNQGFAIKERHAKPTYKNACTRTRTHTHTQEGHGKNQADDSLQLAYLECAAPAGAPITPHTLPWHLNYPDLV